VQPHLGLLVLLTAGLVRDNLPLQESAHRLRLRDVAVQGECEKQNFEKPGYHFTGSRVETRRLPSYESSCIQRVQPRREHALQLLRILHQLVAGGAELRDVSVRVGELALARLDAAVQVSFEKQILENQDITCKDVRFKG
jgi:hypothetical protein